MELKVERVKPSLQRRSIDLVERATKKRIQMMRPAAPPMIPKVTLHSYELVLKHFSSYDN